MWELRAAVEPDERPTKDGEVNNDFVTLRIAWCIGWRNPVICDCAVRENARVEIRGFACTAVKPKASREFHGTILGTRKHS